MIFVFPITIPKNTPASSPLVETLQLASGIIEEAQLFFPPGPIGLAHLYVTNGLNQVWPSNPEQDFASDDETISWADEYPVSQPPFQLVAYGYNLDSLNDHTLTLRVVMVQQVSASSIAQQVTLLLGSSGS